LSKIGDANQIDIIEREVDIVNKPPIEYLPRIKDAKPLIEPKSFNFNGERLYKVIRILNEETIETNTGLNIKFLGVKVIDRERTLKYLKDYILGKEIFIRNYQVLDEHTVKAYVYLKNKIFVNAYLLKSGLALPDLSENHLYKKKFIKLWQEVSSGERVDT
jgi:hypothetical protein